MNTQWNRIVVSVGTVLAAASFATSALAADSADGSSEQGVGASTGLEIPTRLSNEPRPDEPDGTCSHCTVDDLRLDYDESGTSTATLDLYFEDNGSDVSADIVIRVLLLDGGYRFLTIPDAQLTDGELHAFELAPESDWDWQDARYAWVEVD